MSCGVLCGGDALSAGWSGVRCVTIIRLVHVSNKEAGEEEGMTRDWIPQRQDSNDMT